MNRKQRRAQAKTAATPGSAALPPATVQLEANRLNDQALRLHAAGRPAEAIALLRQAIMLNGRQPLFHSNLGELLRQSGDLEAARASLQQAILLAPKYAEAHNNYGNLLGQLGELDDAIKAYEAAIGLKPDYAEAMSNLGAALINRHDHAGAADILRRAIALNPGIAMFHKNLGIALIALGDVTGAEAAFKATFAAPVKLPADSVELMIALGDLERFKGDIEAALHWYHRAWQAKPGDGEAHMRYAVALMVKGEYREAWPHFGARWSLADTDVDKRPFDQPIWRGGPLPSGGRMLLFTEQGVGETLVLISLIPELLQKTITPVIECDPRMIPLLQRSFPGIEAYARTNPPNPRFREPDLAVQATLFDVAAVLRQSPADCTGALALRADTARAEALRAGYRKDHGGPLVGIAWHSANPKLGAPKSAQLADFAPFLSLPGYRFVDLQYGNREADRQDLKAACGAELLVDPDIDQLKDLDAFAAQVAAMDLVIATSNTTAHMAAALGKPTWVLLNKGISPHWYWGLEGERTPWYPTARLWRQQTANDWRGQAESVAAELKRTLPSTTS
ncbi:MAG: tetratricopeptide repeat protein [Ferrovibrio sp.]|uniref:tetratricopeptide repeat protein n=1 Tax=Ferrovibrio sp. TaxID=1917215 RepID=UPI00391BE65E